MTYAAGLVHNCSNSSALAMELLQSCTKPSICPIQFVYAFINFVLLLSSISNGPELSIYPYSSGFYNLCWSSEVT